MILGALLAATQLASPTSADPHIEMFAQACLSQTPMPREALANMAREGRWDIGQGETPDHLEWRDVYRHGTVIVRLDQYRQNDSNPGERICVVLVGEAPSGWQSQVSALEANGTPVGAPGSYDTDVYQLPSDLELMVWDLPDGSRIHALRTSDNILELSVNYPTGS